MWEAISNVHAAVVYLFPGFLAYSLIYRAVCGVPQQTEFEAGAKSVLWSVAIFLAVTLWGGAWRYEVDWGHPGTTICLMALAVVSGCGAAVLQLKWDVTARMWKSLARLAGKPTLWSPLVWCRLVDKYTGGVVAYVRMADGTTFCGALSDVAGAPDEQLKELLLDDAWVYQPEGGRQRIGREVYIRADQVSAIIMGPTTQEILDAMAGTQPPSGPPAT